LYEQRFVIDSEPGRALTVCAGFEPRNEANARLIAAAPDLLRLAQEVAKLNHKQERIGPGMMATLLEMAHKAIAKATDNTPTT
jgi:hypothetical protein